MRCFRTILFLVAAAGLGCGAPDEATEPGAPVAEFLDPLAVDGEHYLLELENDFVRVLRENVPAGEAGPMHSHRARVNVVLKDSEVELTPRGGEPIVTTQLAGSASWIEPVTHSAVTRTDVENLSIELEELHGEAIPRSDVDGTLVDPEHHVIEIENDLVRVVRMTYPPHSTSPVHDHPPGFAVFLTNGTFRNIPEGVDPGEIEPREAVYGTTNWSEGGPPHATENLGDEDFVVIRVEWKKKPS